MLKRIILGLVFMVLGLGFVVFVLGLYGQSQILHKSAIFYLEGSFRQIQKLSEEDPFLVRFSRLFVDNLTLPRALLIGIGHFQARENEAGFTEFQKITRLVKSTPVAIESIMEIHRADTAFKTKGYGVAAEAYKKAVLLGSEDSTALHRLEAILHFVQPTSSSDDEEPGRKLRERGSLGDIFQGGGGKKKDSDEGTRR